MINLLPLATKKQLKAAHMNALLVKYVIFLIASVVFLAGASYASNILLTSIKSSAEATIKSNAAKTDTFSSLSMQASQINSNLSMAKGILDSQVSFSDIIIGIGAAMPEGAVVEVITISNNTLYTEGITINVRTKKAGTSDTVIANLQKSPLFSSVTSQAQQTDSADASGYSILNTIQLKVNRISAS